MKISKTLTTALAFSTLVASAAFAGPKTYQVTGPVLDVSPDTITVQKGKEKWEIARDPNTQVNGGEIKKGDKVTIQYRMTATTVDIKGAGKAAKSKK